MRVARGGTCARLTSYLGAVYAFLYLPIAVLMVLSFNKAGLPTAWGGFSLEWYGKLAANPKITAAAWNSLVVAVMVDAHCHSAWHAAGTWRRAREALRRREALLFAPMIIPDIVLAIALLSFFTLVRFTLGLHSIIMAHVVFNIAFVCAVVRARLKSYDWSLDEASRDLGAGALTTFWRITLPLILPAVIAAALAGLHALGRRIHHRLFHRGRRPVLHDAADADLRHDPLRRDAGDQRHGDDRHGWSASSWSSPPSGSIADVFRGSERSANSGRSRRHDGKGSEESGEEAGEESSQEGRRRSPAAGKKPKKVIALFPEAAFGPALNSVGIGQALEKLGHKVVFLSDPGFIDVYKGYGFEAHPVNLSEPLPPEEMAKFWVDFINGHIPNFRKTPYEQIDNYVKDCWEHDRRDGEMGREGPARRARQVKPDVVCVDNVILFPAIKRYAKENRKPWVRIISCSENEIEDPDIPPHLSARRQGQEGSRAYRKRFNEVIKPIHENFNAFLKSVGEKKYPLGQFFEASPHMNILLYPSAVKFKRRHKLPARQFQYLEGCVRKDKPYKVPRFKANNDKPLLYVSFGSLGSGDIDLLKRLIAAIGKMPVRALVNVGDYKDQYSDIPPNVIIDNWFPQPSVIPQVDARDPSRRQQLLHRVPLFRQARDHHALCVGRP